MTHKDIYTKFMIEYDKANVTSSYPSLTEYEVAVVLDKAYNALIAQKVTGNNPRRVGFEQDVKAIEDLSPLIIYKSIYSPINATAVASNVVKYVMPEHLYFISGYLTKTIDYATNKATGKIRVPRRTELMYTNLATWEMGDTEMFDKYAINGDNSVINELGDNITSFYVPWDIFCSYIADTPETSTIHFYYEEGSTHDGQMPFTVGLAYINEDGATHGGPALEYVYAQHSDDIFGAIDLQSIDLRTIKNSIEYQFEQNDWDAADHYLVITPASLTQLGEHLCLTIRRGQQVPYSAVGTYTGPSDENTGIDTNSTTVGTPMDGQTKRTVPITLVTHLIALQFFATAYNMPWIKNPVCYIESEYDSQAQKYVDKLYVVYDSYDKPDTSEINIVYIKKPNPFVKKLDDADAVTYISFFDPGSSDDSAYQFELNDTMAEELISLAVAFALENVESPRLNSKLNMRGLEA